MAAFALLLSAFSGGASACAVCFGKAIGQQGFFNGLTIAIFLLIGTTMLLLAGIGAAMVRIERRRAAADRAGQ